MIINHRPHIKSWAQFDRKIRFSGQKLLGQLDNYHNSILVAGCQRSGTTALSRLITETEGMVNFQIGKDDELDAALILSGWISHQPQGRYCFQTTYLNNHYPEYFEHKDYKLIWLLRNPTSVVYSMLHNWKTAALNRLFLHCGSKLLEGREKWKYEHFGVFSISRLQRACLSYNAKVSQIFTLHRKLGHEQLLIIDYEELISNKDKMLSMIYQFIDIPYKNEYSDKLHSGSFNKADCFRDIHGEKLENLCMPVYEKACALISS